MLATVSYDNMTAVNARRLAKERAAGFHFNLALSFWGLSIVLLFVLICVAVLGGSSLGVTFALLGLPLLLIFGLLFFVKAFDARKDLFDLESESVSLDEQFLLDCEVRGMSRMNAVDVLEFVRENIVSEEPVETFIYDTRQAVYVTLLPSGGSLPNEVSFRIEDSAGGKVRRAVSRFLDFLRG